MPTGGRNKPVRERRVTRGWRTTVLAHAEFIRSEVVLAGEGGRFTVDPDTLNVTRGSASDADVRVARMVLEYADDAVWFATQRSWPWHWVSGGHNEGAWSRLHVAEEMLVEVMSPARLASYVPVAAYMCRRLAPSDPRRRAVERVAKSPSLPARQAYVRGVLRDAVRAAVLRNDSRFQKARSLRNLTIAMATVLFALAAVAVYAGWRSPESLPMCLESDVPVVQQAGGTGTSEETKPPPQVCPTDGMEPGQGDVALVALVGMAAASISAARALSGTTQRLGPYSPVAAQGALKIVMGALFAIAGVTLLRAGWVPGVDDVDTGAEILAWALLFGYGQQALTRLLDQKTAEALAPEAARASGAGAGAGGDGAADAMADAASDAAADVPADVPADDVPADVPADGAGDDAADGAPDVAPGADAAALPDNPPDEGTAAGGAAVVPDSPDEMEPIDEADAGEFEEMAPPDDVPPPVKKAPAKKAAKKAPARR